MVLFPKTHALIGDSIMASTGDDGMHSIGGFAVRALANQPNLSYVPGIQPLYGYVRVPLGGEQAAQFANALNTNQFDRTRHYIATLASNVICNYGTNDLSFGLSAMQTSILQIASWYAAHNQKFFQCTLFPKTASTDGWQTTANQTTFGGNETTRVNFNNWVRDPSASGFIAQAAALTGKLASMFGFIDVCKYTEVNASNVLTLNGGFWIIPPTTVFQTGTFTGIDSSVQFDDTNVHLTANQYAGYTLLITSGAAVPASGQAGQAVIFWNNTITQYNIGNTVGATTPSIGDSYSIVTLATIDGTHPSSWSHVAARQAVIDVFSQFV